MCVHFTLCMICMMIGSYCFFCFELHTAICLCSFILPGVPTYPIWPISLRPIPLGRSHLG